MLIKPFSSASTSMGLGQISLEGMGRAHNEITKQKSKANLVKGKKDFARNRAIISSPPAAVTPKVKLPNSTDRSSSIAKIQADFNGEFKFGANPDTKMAY
nr:hypothetical protein CFP56_46903 [Quercus suber]